MTRAALGDPAAVVETPICLAPRCRRPRQQGYGVCVEHGRRRDRDLIDLIAAILRGAPSLPNALCRDRSEVFDADTAEAITEARQICAVCLELAACREWSQTLPRGRVAGVIGGRLRHARGSTAAADGVIEKTTS